MFRPVQFDPTSLVLITAAVAVAPLVSAAVPAGLVSVLAFPGAAIALRRAARSGEAPA
jgi:hypothetical protein